MSIASVLMLAGALGAGGLAAPSTAPQSCVLRRGLATGDWDLPPTGPGSFGAIDGDLFLNGAALYHLSGTIAEVGLACPSCRGGTYAGTLDDGVGAGPDYVVSGTWYGDFFSGKGTLQGEIFKNVGPAQISVGKMQGRYKDPMGVPDPVGSFAARWKICD